MGWFSNGARKGITPASEPCRFVSRIEHAKLSEDAEDPAPNVRNTTRGVNSQRCGSMASGARISGDGIPEFGLFVPAPPLQSRPSERSFDRIIISRPEFVRLARFVCSVHCDAVAGNDSVIPRRSYSENQSSITHLRNSLTHHRSRQPSSHLSDHLCNQCSKGCKSTRDFISSESTYHQ